MTATLRVLPFCSTGAARMLRKEASPLAESLARIPFSRQNKRPQLESRASSCNRQSCRATTSQLLLLTPLPPPARASSPATQFIASPFPVCPAALISQSARWEHISQRSLAVSVQGRLGLEGWVMQVQLLRPLYTWSPVHGHLGRLKCVSCICCLTSLIGDLIFLN